MSIKKKNIIKLVSILILLVLLSIIFFINSPKEFGKIYFNKPVSWDFAYAYLYDDNKNEPLGAWPGQELTHLEDYIYYFNVTKDMIQNPENISNYKIIFNSGNSSPKYEINAICEGYNKIFNITTGIGEKNTSSTGNWLNYNENIKIGKIPTTNSKIKNVIYMIGDGMGENHIIAGGLYNEKTLNIQKINNKSYVKTASTKTITDSAAGATALATGYKTNNGVLGKNKNGENVESLIEYAHSNNLKTGLVCTQIINHATPAGFSVHIPSRYNYKEIALSQVKSNIDLMLGGRKKIFFFPSKANVR